MCRCRSPRAVGCNTALSQLTLQCGVPGIRACSVCTHASKHTDAATACWRRQHAMVDPWRYTASIHGTAKVDEVRQAAYSDMAAATAGGDRACPRCLFTPSLRALLSASSSVSRL